MKGKHELLSFSPVQATALPITAMQNQGLTVPDRNICWYTTQELDDFRQSRDISFLKKFLERITPDCTAFICEDDFIA